MPQSKDFPDCFYRVSIKALVVKDGKIMHFKESPSLSGEWELPGGGLDFGEDIESTLKRELLEEAGLKLKSISKSPVYVWPWKLIKIRKMDWFYSLVVAYQVELEDFNFTKTEECQEIGFFSKDELMHITLCHQTKGLKEHFDPKDFS